VRSRRFVREGKPGGIREACFVDEGMNLGIQALAYSSSTAPRPAESRPAGKFIWMVPPGGRVLLIPTSLPRPPGDQQANAITVALLTPLLVVADVVVTPVFLVMFAATGPC
jgi:hypothetical protein